MLNVKCSVRIIVGIILLSMTSSVAPAVQTNVRATAILFRHGQRTPVHSIPEIRHRLTKELGHGQLTNTGVRQLFNNGNRLRKKYLHLFPEDGFFKLSNMKIMTSVPERTMMSLQAFMAGFLPPPPQDDELPIKWQPFYTSVDHQGKMVFYDQRACPRFTKDLCDLILTPPEDILAWMKKDRPVLDELSKITGRPLKTVLQVGLFADMIKTQMYICPDTPQWAIDAYYSTLMKYIGGMFRLFHGTQEMIKIRGGPLLTEIVNNMVAVNENHVSGRNFLIYSAHDMTVLSLAYVLGVQSQIPAMPHYSDTFMVDLLDDGQVQVVYMNTERHDEPTMTVMDVPGCGLSCPLDKFREVFKDMLVDDFDTLCKI